MRPPSCNTPLLQLKTKQKEVGLSRCCSMDAILRLACENILSSIMDVSISTFHQTSKCIVDLLFVCHRVPRHLNGTEVAHPEAYLPQPFAVPLPVVAKPPIQTTSTINVSNSTVLQGPGMHTAIYNVFVRNSPGNSMVATLPITNKLNYSTLLRLTLR